MDTVKKKLKRLEEPSFVSFCAWFFLGSLNWKCMWIMSPNPYVKSLFIRILWCCILVSRCFIQSAHSQSSRCTFLISKLHQLISNRCQAPWVWQFCFSFDVLLQFGISEKHHTPQFVEPWGNYRGTKCGFFNKHLREIGSAAYWVFMVRVSNL